LQGLKFGYGTLSYEENLEWKCDVADFKLMFDCDLCGQPYQHGPHRYEGSKWHRYDMMVCENCHESNRDGIGPMLEPKFEALLKTKGISLPTRNSTGWYPRG
jgi:hypothetical protein